MEVSLNELQTLLSSHEDFVSLEKREDKVHVYMSSAYATADIHYAFEKIGLLDRISVITCRKVKR
jgi:hypothetical protein